MTPYPQTTAHEREILKHYYMHAGEDGSHMPWKGGSEYWLPLDMQIVAKLVAAGLLVYEPGDAPGCRRIRANREALAVYFHALDCVPLPVRVWHIPEFQA